MVILQLSDFPRFNLNSEVLLPNCKYTDISTDTFSDWNDKFAILLFNVRSCRKNFLDFTCCFDDILNKFSCIILTETWLTEEYNNLFVINGFRSFDSYRTNNGGGIRLYVKCNLRVNLLSPFNVIDNVCEIFVVEISVNDKKCVLCCFYHPPTSDHGLNYDFIEQCCNTLKLLKTFKLPIIACGDFNLNMFNPLKLNYISYFTESMFELSFYPLITIPTKYNPNNEVTKYALIDHIWVSSPSCAADSFVVPINLTDHFPCIAVFNFDCKQSYQFRTKRVFNHINNIKFSRSLMQICPNIIGDDVDHTFDNYWTNVFHAYNHAYPVIEKLASLSRNNEWLTPPIKACIRKKSNLYYLFIRGSITKESYTYYANLLTTLLRRVKKLHFFKLFLNAFGDSARVWHHINRLLGNSHSSVMEKLIVGSGTLTGEDMINYANDYFVSIACNLTVGIQNRDTYNFYGPPNRHTFFLAPANESEVVTSINKLKNKGNVIVDLSVQTVKNNACVFSRHLVFLYNYSIEKSSFPNRLKIACVIPGHKSGPKEIIDNYRPISNLPVLSKIFETLSLSRMTSFVEKCNLLSNAQFGFRKGKNITLAALTLTTSIVHAYHLKYFSCCFFLDLRKAFDTIDHKILLSKLDHMGFRGQSNEYLESYLSNRKQYIQVGNCKSKELSVNKGVPQGSILGPLLFCLYIDDIVQAVDVDVVLFADDAAFIIIAPSLLQLYEKVQKLFVDLQLYLSANKLVPNLNKSKLMCFSSRTVPLLQDLRFNDRVIEWVNEYKYLGLIISNKMTFDAHIETVAGRISRFSGVFCHLRSVLPRYVLKLLYFSFIVPHILLHVEIWGSSPGYHINKLKTKVNSLLRIILNVQFENGRPLMNTDTLYKNLGLLNVNSLFKCRLFKLLMLMLKGELPLFYDRLLRPYEASHRYATRSGAFRHPLLTCEVERRAVSHQLVILYESLPEIYFSDISIYSSIKHFKRYLLQTQ